MKRDVEIEKKRMCIVASHVYYNITEYTTNT